MKPGIMRNQRVSIHFTAVLFSFIRCSFFQLKFYGFFKGIFHMTLTIHRCVLYPKTKAFAANASKKKRFPLDKNQSHFLAIFRVVED